jgi:trehalose 6-phosphate phosphatase
MTPPQPQPGDALFLDFDGTLVEIASEPQSVVVGAPLRELLQHLQGRLAGAVALISGRPIADIDRQLRPLQLAAAGEHGAEIRHRPGSDIDAHQRLPAVVVAYAEQLQRELPEVLVELKAASVSVHFRAAPARQPEVEQRLQRLALDWPDYELLHGKMVVEFKPGAVDKGRAIRALAAQPPFRGRRPVFIGDDTTDEAGFGVVNELGGLSIRVGHRPNSAARYQLADVAAVHAWLAQLQ